VLNLLEHERRKHNEEDPVYEGLWRATEIVERFLEAAK
jgi:hypothetical protein